MYHPVSQEREVRDRMNARIEKSHRLLRRTYWEVVRYNNNSNCVSGRPDRGKSESKLMFERKRERKVVPFLVKDDQLLAVVCCTTTTFAMAPFCPGLWSQLLPPFFMPVSLASFWLQTTHTPDSPIGDYDAMPFLHLHISFAFCRSRSHLPKQVTTHRETHRIDS